MEKEKVNSIIIQYKDYLPQDKILYLKTALEKVEDSAYDDILVSKIHSPTTTLILSIFLGAIGIDRFYIGDVGIGVCKLLFGWLTLGIWPIIDIFCSFKRAKVKNFENILANIS